MRAGLSETHQRFLRALVCVLEVIPMTDIGTLTLPQMREILSAARAQGWAPRTTVKPHVMSPATGACTRCGRDRRAVDLSDSCEPLPMGGEYTRDDEARARALDSRPLPLLSFYRTNRVHCPDDANTLVMDVPGRVGNGQSCDYGCDTHAVNANCATHMVAGTPVVLHTWVCDEDPGASGDLMPRDWETVRPRSAARIPCPSCGGRRPVGAPCGEACE